jgi:trimeric autotransporter adhesin
MHDFNNVAIGVGSLGGDTLGSRSTAIGYNALTAQNFTTATNTYNVAVGYSAGGANTTGTSNTFLGATAGAANTSGNNNSAMGYAALFTNILSDRNVAIGHNALYSHNQATSVDSYNVAVGYDAGSAVTTGIDQHSHWWSSW